MNNSDTKITNPFQLRRELAGVNNLDIATGILRRTQWYHIVEMKERLSAARLYTEIGNKNDSLLSICMMLLEWVRTLEGKDDQTITDKGLHRLTIDELLAPHDMLYKMAIADD
jgi:hypothetical protein